MPPGTYKPKPHRLDSLGRLPIRGGPLVVFAVVFAVALLWRLGYLLRLDASLLARSVVADSEIYWKWASFLREHGWLGQNPFFMGPLYPYTLAVLRSVLGDSIPAVLGVQAVGGALACGLLADVVRRAVGPALGLLVGLWAAFYEMAVFMDGLVLMESQLFVLEVLLLWWVALRPPAERRPGTLFGIGALLGLLAAARASSLLLVPVALVFFLVPAPARVASRLRRGVLLVTGVLAVIAPIALRNYAVGREWIPLTYNGGLNLYIGNSPQANGTFVLVTGTQAQIPAAQPEGVSIDGREWIELTTGQRLTAAQSSRWWGDRARAWIGEHTGDALRLVARRLAMLWNRTEYPQVESLDEFREVAGPLGLPFVGSFVVLGPLALFGLYVVVVRRRGGWIGAFAASYAGAMTLAILPFFVTDRYRHHLVPAALVLAGIGLAEIIAAFRRREHAASLPLVVLVLVSAIVVVHLPVPRLSEAKREWGMFADLGTRALEKDRPADAVRAFERALAIEQGGSFGASGAVDTQSLERAALYTNYALALEQVGRGGEARAWLVRALALAPDNSQVLGALARHEEARGATAAADSLYRRMGGTVQGGEAGAFGRGMIAAREGRLDDAAARFAEAVRIDPSNHGAWGALVRVELQAGRAAAAESVLDVASKAGWSDDAATLHRALTRAARGDFDGARRLRAGVSGTAIAGDPVLEEVNALLDRMLAAQAGPTGR